VTDRSLRVLLVADTHIGIDLPLRPRVQRRRRGHDFLRNFHTALEPALGGEVDIVVHGGDLLDRSKVPDQVVQLAFQPLLQAARAGAQVFVVPGNHERSRIPLRLWSVHPNFHIFHQPTTFVHVLKGMRIAVSGFPCSRRVRDEFAGLLARTGYASVSADVRLLCMHLAVEGAQVGVHNYTFRHGPHVVRGRDIPGHFAAVLAGHIHRHQILTHDLRGRPLAAPVIYSGSVERTAFAERNEEKGYVLAEFTPTTSGRGELVDMLFVPLPTRTMVSLALQADAFSADALRTHLRRRLAEFEPEAVVRIELQGNPSSEAQQVLSAASLRSLAPAGMNVSVRYPRDGRSFAGRQARRT
jgi:exonuclease SbcD